MKFEGEDKVIPLRGIERAGADEVQQDGGLEDAIGLIARNGSFIPYEPHHERVSDFGFAGMGGTVVMVRVHKTSMGDNVIWVRKSGPSLYKIYWCAKANYDAQIINESNDNLIKTTSDAIEDIVFMGNYLILKRDTGLEYWLFYNEKYESRGGYTEDENFLTMPTVNFKVEAGIYKDGKTYDFYREIYVNDAWWNFDWWKADTLELMMSVERDDETGKFPVVSDMIKALSVVRENGGITGYVLVTYAWHRKDGGSTGYDCFSVPVLMGAPERYRKDTTVYRKPTNGNIAEKNGIIDCIELPEWNLMGNLASNISAAAIRSRERKLTSSLVEGGKVKLWHNFTDLESPNEYKQYKFDEDEIRPPFAWCSKYLSFYKNSSWHLMRATCATGNSLYLRINDAITDDIKNKYDKLAVFISPIITPYKTLQDEHSSNIKNTFEDGLEYIYDTKGQAIMLWQMADKDRGWGIIESAGAVGSLVPEMKDEDTILDEIKGIESMYKVWDDYLDNIETGQWIQLRLPNLNSLTTETALPISSFFQSLNYTIGSPFVYNHRLHLFNNKNYLKQKPSYTPLLYFEGAGQDFIGTTFRGSSISDASFLIIITKKDGGTYVEEIAGSQALSPILCYAGEALSCEIRLRYYFNGNWWENIRTYNNPIRFYQDKMTMFYVGRNFLSCVWHDHGALSNGKSENPEQIDVPEESPYYYNQLKYGTTVNSLTINTSDLTVGNGTILGLAKFGINLSQDNFDKYPLVAFCTDGVWLIGINENGMYDGCRPFSRLVCSNPKGICSIDSGIVFPTENGLYLLTNEGVKPISAMVIGEVKHVPTDSISKGKGLKLVHNAISHEQITSLAGIAGGEDFREFINLPDTTISYLPELNSLIIYNKTKAYCYTLVLDTLYAFRTNFGLTLGDGNYPTERFYKIGEYVRTFKYEGEDTATDCYLQTRPIKTESDVLKTTYRVALRGKFTGWSGKYVGLYVLGSLDGEHWQVVGAKEKELSADGFKDLGCITYRTSLKYLMAVMTGKLGTDSHIDAFDITQTSKYNNKLK